MKKSLSKKTWILLIILISIILIFINYRYEKYENKNKKLYFNSEKQIFSNEFLSVFINKIDHEKIPLLDSLNPELLEAGKKEMAKHKLIITGITRDNIKDFFVMVKNIEYIGKFFKDYRVILFENDSKDGTKEALKIWQQNNPKVKIISQNFNVTKRSSHKFMADARNYYVDDIKNKEYDGFNIIMAIDMDLTRGIDIRGIEDSFSKINQWDAICSNGIKGSSMYDIFAFRDDNFPWPPETWQEICTKRDSTNKWTEVCNLGEKLYGKPTSSTIEGTWQRENHLYWDYIVPQEQKIYSVNMPLVSVDSCFGGMAFYKRTFIEGCFYDSINNDCEHILFHECLRSKNQGKIFMNPAQMLRYD